MQNIWVTPVVQEIQSSFGGIWCLILIESHARARSSVVQRSVWAILVKTRGPASECFETGNCSHGLCSRSCSTNMVSSLGIPCLQIDPAVILPFFTRWNPVGTAPKPLQDMMMLREDVVKEVDYLASPSPIFKVGLYPCCR